MTYFLTAQMEKALIFPNRPVSYLYQNWANPIHISSANDDASVVYDSISSPNAFIEIDSFNHQIFVSPVKRKCTLILWYKKQKIEIWKFPVRKMPKPIFLCKINQTPYQKNVKVAKGSRITLQLIADEALALQSKFEFGYVYIYRISESGEKIEVGAANLGGRDATKGLDFPISGKAYLGASNSRIMIEIQGIYRFNHKGEKVLIQEFTATERKFYLLTK